MKEKRRVENEALVEALIQAATEWAKAKRAWEETARMTERPANLSQIKGDARRAERELLTRIDALSSVDGAQ
jgi:hypothetical protein